MTTLAKIFKHNREYGNYNDGEDDKREISLHNRQIAEIIAPHDKNRNPGNTAQNIV